MEDAKVARDKMEIAELLYRYARACDSRDWPLLRAVFTDDAVLDYSSVGRDAGGREEIVGWLEESLIQLPWSQHLISNIEVDLDGDRARVRAMFYNPMQLPGLAEPSFCGGYYHHDVVRTPDGWKSARLVEENLWFVNPVPAQ
jgi:3-phenylpropionate/cinnamic acid dioxygenase small subunit